MVCPDYARARPRTHRDTVRLFHDDLRVVVRGPSPTGIRAHLVAQTFALPLAGYLEEEPGIDVALDHGDAPGISSGPPAEFCDRLVAELLR